MWWERSWATIQHEFMDLGDAEDVTRIVLRLLVALVLGGLLGLDRERVGAPAGLRTHMLVAVGAALFVLIPQQAGWDRQDLSRVLQGIVTGVGFLGAGAILKPQQQEDVVGLTTAANMWLTAAIGVAAGLGRETTAVLSTLFALLILAILRKSTHTDGKR